MENLNQVKQTSEAKKLFPSFTVKLSGGKSMTYTYRPRPIIHTLLAALLSGFYGNAFALNPNALPTGGNVTSGSASIAQTGSNLNITQTSQSAIINWNTFNIGSSAAVNIAQPNSSSVQLDRVVSQQPLADFRSTDFQWASLPDQSKRRALRLRCQRKRGRLGCLYTRHRRH